MHVRPESSLVGAAAVVAGIVALALLSRLRRRAASTAPTIRLDDEDTSYGDRLDDELAAID